VLATNKDLEQAVKDGEFREDLFYRINVVCVEMPPLRARRLDIQPLAEHFLQRFATEHGRKANNFSDAAAATLIHAQWPGNVRQLENVIERAVMLARGTELRPENLFMPGSALESSAGKISATGQGLGDGISISELEKLHILAVLKDCGGNQKKPAARGHISHGNIRGDRGDRS
ncbi:MAG TPA: sigma-54-dependent Fis family transcriptional regulator, partial [Planctomycetes bacterium]|nr:sigma-54-dependent Fis family transcriptional regulator [Planctomycetota bacterium]